MSGVRSKKRPGGPKSYGQVKTNAAYTESKTSMMQATEPNDESELTTAKAILSLSNNIKEMQKDINALKDDIRQDLSNFKSEMNQKLEGFSMDIRNQGTRLTEAEQRVNELETVNVDLRESLLYCLKKQKILLDKVTDLEGRSRRNNIRIYGIKEGAEGSAMSAFMTNFLKEQLSLGEDVDFQIQRAHRSLGPKPQDTTTTRSIIVNFLRYDMKEKILKAAWEKKITYHGKIISFAHDLPTEINNKLREYKDIKKILKEEKIRFQTPYPAKMRIHWNNGTRLYSNASEAAEDMKKRGYSVETPRSAVVDEEPSLVQDVHWNKEDSYSKRVRQRLRGFQRQQV